MLQVSAGGLICGVANMLHIGGKNAVRPQLAPDHLFK